ncbi:MAG: DNA-processing protein DprA [Rhodocyclaceae bacterium]
MDAADFADWLRLTMIPGLGGEGQRRLLQAFGTPAAVFSASLGSLAKLLGNALAERVLHHEAAAEVAAALAWANQPGNRILTLADIDYPQALLNAPDPPLLLYVKGRIELLNRPAFAIVGSRNATKQGEANAQAFAQTLAAAGLTIVSGMAAGCDAAAHRGALQEAASTIAVIGTGCDRIYPARNEALARAIAEKGCIVSEFPLGTPPLPNNFPRRNRIIAGLSRGCLVVEATKQSGSLITARLAAEAGREVFAIPGSIHSPQSKGCHALIKQGAKLVESAQDILEELRWEQITAPARPEEGRTEDDPILAALGGDPCDLDTLVSRTGLSADVLLAQLLTLEMSGRVAQLPGGRYQRLN